MNLQEFGQSIKAKYPQYQSVDDVELANKIIAKYPQYKSQITQNMPDVKKGLAGMGQTFGDALATIDPNGDIQAAKDSAAGLDEMNMKLAKQIIENKKSGKDTSRLEKMFKENTGYQFDISSILPSTTKTNEQIAGEALSTVNAMTLGANPSKFVGSRIAQGALLGASSGIASGMNDNKSANDVIHEGVGGALTGAVISGLFEGAGALGRKISGSKMVDKLSGNNYNKELQPDTKELANAIKNNFQTFGQKARDVVNNSGKPVYVGTYNTLMNNAKSEVEQGGIKLKTTLGNYKDITASRDEIVGDLVSQLKDQYGSLTNQQIKVVKEFVKKLPQETSVPQMLDYKRLYDKLISSTDWSKIVAGGDSQLAFATQVKYMLRDNLRKLINEKTGDETVKAINNRMSIGMEMRDLAAQQIARRAKQKITAGGGLWGMFGKILDDTVFNPAITTRVSQTAKKLGQNTGQTPLRSITRNVIINLR